MGKKKKTSGTSIWNLVDNFQGDKIIFMIVLLLAVFSIVAISSSTPLLAIQQHSTRMAIISEQLVVVLVGLGIVFGLYWVGRIGWFRVLSQLGYIVSLGMLLFLALKMKLPGIKAVQINGAVRAISIFGFQLHVFEFVKIMMIMYLAWAITAYHRHDFMIVNLLSEDPRLAFLAKPRWQLFFYIFLPMILVCVLILAGSVSSALFIGLIMLVTILVGGISIRDILPYAGVAVVGGFLVVAISFGTDGKVFPRIKTAAGRIERASQDPEEQLLSLPRGSKEFQEVLDMNRQPISAKVAVSEGGLIGKGPGRSTQRYVVPVMFEDYMFSFIIEEYGIAGAIIIIIMYSSLLARGAILVKNCDNEFAKIVVAGLVILISGQSLMHMMINVDLGPLTGQTLPMISHGNSSFIAFSIAFGIILAISRMAKEKVDRETEQAAPIYDTTPEPKDEIQAKMDVLEELDN